MRPRSFLHTDINTPDDPADFGAVYAGVPRADLRRAGFVLLLTVGIISTIGAVYLIRALLTVGG